MSALPVVNVELCIRGWWADGPERAEDRKVPFAYGEFFFLLDVLFVDRFNENVVPMFLQRNQFVIPILGYQFMQTKNTIWPFN